MKRYIKSFTTDELKSALGDKYPKGGYLYIFKHGIGPGTIPDDVKVVKVKDLPNYYTAVWLDRFLTTPELKQYDIPDETRITELLNKIGYCQKNGDVVPCEDVEACGDIKSSTKPRYMANMVSASVDDGFEQLVDTDEDDSTWEEPKYIARSYYGTNYSGLEDDFSTDDPSELIDWIWEHASRGGYIEVEGPKDRIRLDPDVLAENVEFGDIGEYEIMSQIDYL